jgi:uncharacterized protein YcfJ
MKPMTATLSVLALGVVLASASASAQPYGNGPRQYDDERGETRSDVAQVIRVERFVDPYRDYYREQCWNERVNRYEDNYYRDENGRLYRDDGSNGNTGLVVGAIVGGALGHQAGKGDGRTAATIAGAVIGGSIGHQVDRNSGDREYRGSDGIVRRCRTVEGRGSRHRSDGFDVTYRYGGQVYRTHTRRHPGRTIRVLVEVRPQER